MYTVRNDIPPAKQGEPIEITFPIVDKNGDDVNVSTASGVFRVARKKGDAALLEKTDTGIVFQTNSAVVSFNTSEIVDSNDVVQQGKFWYEFLVQIGGDGLYVSEGVLNVDKIIL